MICKCGKEINENEKECKFCKVTKDQKRFDATKAGLAVLGAGIFLGKIVLSVISGKKNI
ncbi:putative nucleic acid-binding Zn ribbon protein [Clostridium beijerinckii]|uniref:hypothetical protein n=1 Tax=Clostridium beijerinckii TaxID=1520 RepID=UPI001493E679|nr:hypothetical protein [Clostridium beijerinckii]NOW84910.1 putative nucleic acid-binding Zn ribbon protein [Clostridium beijerinckii]